VIVDRCKECGLCIEFCPQHALSKSTQTNSKGYHPVCIDSNHKCAGDGPFRCNNCSMVCPDFAISVVPIGEEVEKEAKVEYVE